MRTQFCYGRLTAALLLTTVAGLLAGCGNQNLSRTFGFSRDAPDEFTVTTRAPLSMPPDFALRPPQPGMARPQEQSEARQAEEALVPQTALTGVGQAGMTPGQQALVQQAGPPAPSGIRGEIARDQRQQAANDQGFADRLLFWRESQPQGVVVDPQRESQRLRENSALGQSPDVGDTPIIQPRRKGWLEGLF